MGLLLRDPHHHLTPPERQWEQPYVCLVAPNSIHLQLWVLQNQEVKVHSIRPNRRQCDRRQHQTELMSVLPEAENSSPGLAG